MKTKTSLYLIRLYAVIIAVVVLSDILEGGAFKLVLSITAVLIFLQSFFIHHKKHSE